MNIFLRLFLCVSYCIGLWPSKLIAFVPSYFYRPAPFWQEPRFERQWLSSLDLLLAGGSTCVSRNKCGEQVPLLSIVRSTRVPKSGTLDILELDIEYVQNFTHGFFSEITIPLIMAHLYPCNKDHCSPFRQISVHQENAQISCCSRSFKKTALADTALLLGWTWNYEQTCLLDFIDFTVKAGTLAPTSFKTHNHSIAFPFGYNNRWAFVIALTASAGLYDWLTLGAYSDAVTIFPSKKIKKQDIVYRAGGYIKADHVSQGFSLLMAVTHEGKPRKTHGPFGFVWSRSVIHLSAEYDFSNPRWAYGPRLALTYTRHLLGKNVFNVNMLGGFIACDIDWQF